MMTVIIVLHMIICILLIGIILIQAGRGGGLVEGFSGVESMFGTKTNSFLARTTTILATAFFITCLALAIMSARQGKSLMSQSRPPIVNKTSATKEAAKPEIPKAEAPIQAPKVQETPKTEEVPVPAAAKTN